MDLLSYSQLLIACAATPMNGKGEYVDCFLLTPSVPFFLAF